MALSSRGLLEEAERRRGYNPVVQYPNQFVGQRRVMLFALFVSDGTGHVHERLAVAVTVCSKQLLKKVCASHVLAPLLRRLKESLIQLRAIGHIRLSRLDPCIHL